MDALLLRARRPGSVRGSTGAVLAFMQAGDLAGRNLYRQAVGAVSSRGRCSRSAGRRVCFDIATHLAGRCFYIALDDLVRGTTNRASDDGLEISMIVKELNPESREFVRR